MSRTLSAAAVRELLAQNSSETFLVLLTFEHPSMDTLRVVNNTVDIVSRGNTYTGFPFGLALPSDLAETLASVKLTISNVDRRIVESLRAIPDPISVTLEVITASHPDTVEVGPFTFDMTDASYDQESITATLAYEPILAEPFPAGRFSPQDFPALFAS